MMRYYLHLLVLISFFILIDRFQSTMAGSSTLDNQHLTVAALEYPIDFYKMLNSSGLNDIDQYDGVSCMIIEWLSAAHINTTFSIIPINPLINPLDPHGHSPGMVDLVAKGEYDMMTRSVPTTSRAAKIEYTQPVAYVPVSYLIPSPEKSTSNILSSTKPFQTWVWITLFLTILAVFASVILMESRNDILKKERKRNFNIKMIFYVLGVLLRQAIAHSFSKRLEIRIIIAIWSLASFVLIHSYTSLCISFLTVPVTNPLIQSIHELQNSQRSEIRVVTDKNRNTEDLLLSAESGLLKELGDRIRADSGSLCDSSSQCVDAVKEGHAIYTAGRDIFLLKSLKEDFEATGKCNMELSKENYIELHLSWALKKKSPYIDSLNKSFMKMSEAGLLQKWHKERLPNIAKCFPRNGRKREKIMDERRAPLSLEVFTGAFIMLALGSMVAVIVFLIENKIIGRIIICRNNPNVITV